MDIIKKEPVRKDSVRNKIGKRYTNDRTRLETVIPLTTPYLVFLDPSSSCNFKCKFCPCGGANKEYWSENKKVGILSYETARKVIDDITEFPDKIKTLRLYKEGEPLLNKRLPDIINYARKKDVAERIDFTTNGSLLTHDLGLAIADAGVDRINISVEAIDDDDYFSISGVKIEFRRYVNNIKFFYNHKNGCHVFVKISDLGLGKHSAEEFYDIFGEICDEIAVERVSNVWPDFSVKEELKKTDEYDIYGGKMSERSEVQVCPYLFYSLCVNSDGTVSSCLMDWNHVQIIGNVNDSSLHEIWNGDTLNRMRLDHLRLNRKVYPACAKCGQMKYAVLDNIDQYRKEILQNIEEKL